MFNPDVPDEVLQACKAGNSSSELVRNYIAEAIKGFVVALTVNQEKNKAALTETEGKIRIEEHNKQEAAAQGDRSENAEYHAAVEKLAELEKIAVSQRKKQNAYDRFLGDSRFHAYIIEDSCPHCRFWVLVPDAISDVTIGALSNKSPIGEALAQNENLTTFTINRGNVPINYTIWR